MTENIHTDSYSFRVLNELSAAKGNPMDDLTRRLEHIETQLADICEHMHRISLSLGLMRELGRVQPLRFTPQKPLSGSYRTWHRDPDDDNTPPAAA